MKVAGETWEQPLISLDEMLRIEISSYYLLLARKWWDGELFDMILKRLQVQLGEIPFIDQPPESLLKLGEQQRWMIVWEILLSSFIIVCYLFEKEKKKRKEKIDQFKGSSRFTNTCQFTIGC